MTSKIMKAIKYIFQTILLGLILVVTGCTDSFNDYNTDPYSVKPEYQKGDWLYLGGYITQMEKSIYSNANNWDWDFQIAQNLSADIYSGYLAPPTPFAGGKNNANYNLMGGWNLWSFKIYNERVMAPWLELKKLTKDKNEFPEIYAVANILKVTAMMRNTDIYGPIPYSQYGKGGVSVAYDSQENVYMQFIDELDEAQTNLEAFLKSDRKNVKAIQNYDIVYKSDYEKWIRYANSLRLRLAVRIAKVKPTLAKEQAEKAVNNEYGVIESNKDNFIVATATMKNPLNILAYAYNDTRMSADIQSILVGLKDPRIEKYFLPATDKNPEIEGKYIGVRQGIEVVDKKMREGYSNLGEAWKMGNENNNDICLLNAAEVCFLRAEGILRGWNMGSSSVQNLYEEGIRLSFDYWKADGSALYIQGTTKPIDYVDFAKKKEDGTHDTAYDAPAASTVTVKWDDTAALEQKLEKVITQKWIAIFPDGCEAWAEFRRTGYPKQFPMVVNYSAGTIDSNIKIRRLPFSQDEYRDNKTEVEKAVTLLKGEDNGGTQLWWDTNHGTANF